MSRITLITAVSVGVLYAGLASAEVVNGPQRVIVLRVYFSDYLAASRYTKAEVEALFDQVDTLWQNTSYGNISIDYQVSDLFQLPEDRSAYVDDGVPDGDTLCDDEESWWDGEYGAACDPCGVGDLTCGDEFDAVLEDAIANSPEALDWTDIDVVLVLMAETDDDQWHRGWGAASKNLPMGPDGESRNVGAAVFSENPSDTDLQVWGRWCHEIGHAFQQGGPLHPSDYNSYFELMDYNYPGQTGVFEKQDDMGFPGWLVPATKYQTFTPSCDVGPEPCTGLGGGTAAIWAMEYDPDGRPNDQAVKAYITDNLYYLISVRRRVLGDELNGRFQGGDPGTNGIPDEGVLIERVEEQASPWVTLQFPAGGGRNDLWHAGDVYENADDGIRILVAQMIDEDNYYVQVSYGDGANQADVGLNPWQAPPGNAYETTDIWVDSPVNGYGEYRRELWDDGTGNDVPRGNGDDPAIGLVNRLYARVRNFGALAAADVVVHFEITDPPGLAIAASNGFIPLGTVTSAEFPTLANIDPGEFTDVYLEWTPDFAIPEEDLEDGRFAFHTCVRVILDTVDGETVLGNQDGDREQENIFYFQVPPEGGAGAPDYEEVIHLRNDDLANSKFFYLNYESNLPASWKVELNGGDLSFELDPGELRDIPIHIEEGAPQPVGSIFGVNVAGSSLRKLVSDLDPDDTHMELKTLGGVYVEVRVLRRPDLSSEAERQGGDIVVSGQITFPANDRPARPRVMIVGADAGRNFLPSTSRVLDVGTDGLFSGQLHSSDDLSRVREVVALFAGTTRLTGAASGYLPIAPEPEDNQCVTAVAAAGSYLEPHLQVVRDFRDDYLLPYSLGRAFVGLYYEISPAMADYLRERESVRVLSRWALTPLVYGIEYRKGLLSIMLVLVTALVARKRISAFRGHAGKKKHGLALVNPFEAQEPRVEQLGMNG